MKARKKFVDFGKLKKNIQRGCRKIAAAKSKIKIRRPALRNFSAGIIGDVLENLSDGNWN